ncbi:hypothetical protein HY212_06565 [Candidatus Pacearchaeota archaeon]|nr:hypothetical protein [Candidatus Pacearchaeota archaeon]
MAIILGIESTAHTFGIGIVKNGKILANIREMYSTEKGGIIPAESAKHHERVADDVFERALAESKIKEKDIDVIAFSQGPGLTPCLLVGLREMKKWSAKLKIPVVPVNHCIAHLEIGRITGAKDSVLLYASGANTQVIAYESGKYRIFGETLDLGVGNFIDVFARYMGLGFPGGPNVEQLALKSRNYIELPYTVKGMDIALSGLLTNLKQKIEKMDKYSQDKNQVSYSHHPTQNMHSHKVRDIDGSEQASPSSSLKNDIISNKNIKFDNRPSKKSSLSYLINSQKIRANENERGYSKEDLAFSMQETVFAMLVEVAERALAHIGKKELVLGGGVACNSRIQEMCNIMCKERGAKMFVPSRDLLVDNGAMIAYLGEIMFNAGIKVKGKDIVKLDVLPRQRTDEVNVSWK